MSGVYITVFNSGWVKADNRVLLSGGDKKNIDMPALCALIEHPTQGNNLYDVPTHCPDAWQALQDQGMGFANHD